jgi:hypothetical protein
VVDVDGHPGAALVAAGVQERAISDCPMLTSTIQLRCLARSAKGSKPAPRAAAEHSRDFGLRHPKPNCAAVPRGSTPWCSRAQAEELGGRKAEKLADVGAFVAAALPGCVRVRDLEAGCDLDPVMEHLVAPIPVEREDSGSSRRIIERRVWHLSCRRRRMSNCGYCG